jgi:hypothetical protein
MDMPLGFGFGELIVALLVLVLTVLPAWRVVAKAGYSGAWSLLMFVPLVNFIALYVPGMAAGAPGVRRRRAAAPPDRPDQGRPVEAAMPEDVWASGDDYEPYIGRWRSEDSGVPGVANAAGEYELRVRSFYSPVPGCVRLVAQRGAAGTDSVVVDRTDIRLNSDRNDPVRVRVDFVFP